MPDAPKQSLRILLAEDDPVHQQFAATLLRARGHRVDVVGDGRQAVTAVADRRYDAVVMDVEMPELDGLSATRAIRAMPVAATLPIIAVTAMQGGDVRDRCLAAGMTAYLAKPVDPQTLVAIVEGVLERWGAAPAPPVDLAALRRSMRTAGIEAALEGILALYVEEAPERLRAVEAGVDARDAERVRQAAHAYRSAAGTIAASALGALLERMERAGRAGDVATAGALLPQVRAEHDAVLALVRAAARPADDRNEDHP